MRIVVDENRKVLMWSPNGDPAVGEAQQLIELTAEQAEALAAAMAAPNSGLTFDGSTFSTIPLPMPQDLTLEQKLASIGIDLETLREAILA